MFRYRNDMGITVEVEPPNAPPKAAGAALVSAGLAAAPNIPKGAGVSA